MRRSVWGSAAAAAYAFSMAGGIAFAAALSYAEIVVRRDTVPALIRAVRLDRFYPPSGYLDRLAVLDPERSPDWIHAELQANPREASAWIDAGLAEEHNGATVQAERDLLQAAAVDHQYLPAWTLANFYFRQNRRGEFWIWARRAAALTYDDFRPLLVLAHALEPDPRAVVQNLGDGEQLLHADLDYLAEKKRLDDAQQIARLLMARRNPADRPRVIELAMRQIRAGHPSAALELWNAVSAPLDPDGGVLANRSLAKAPSGLAFDWSLPRNSGVSGAWQPGQLTFTFSGAQPESCTLLEQIVVLDPARHYRLRFEYRSDSLTDPTGLAWDLDGDSAEVPTAGTWLSASDFLRVKGFASGGLRLAHLRLLYRREPGTIRATGQIQIRNLNLEAL